MATEECGFGEGCIFAHGEAELRSETNNETLKLANQLIGISEVCYCLNGGVLG